MHIHPALGELATLALLSAGWVMERLLVEPSGPYVHMSDKNGGNIACIIQSGVYNFQDRLL